MKEYYYELWSRIKDLDDEYSFSRAGVVTAENAADAMRLADKDADYYTNNIAKYTVRNLRLV